MEALLLALVGVLGAGHLAILVAWMAGQIVSGTRLDSANTANTRLQAALEKKDDAYETLRATVDRQAMVADVTRAVLEATRGAIGRGAP